MNPLVNQLKARFLPEFEKVLRRICQTINILGYLLICLGCGTYTKTESITDLNYACKNYRFSALMENVDAETNGKKSGDTHFHSSAGAEVFFSYNLTGSNEKSIEEIRVKENAAKSVIRKSVLRDVKAKKVGEKLVIFSEDKLPISKTIEKKYYLLWTYEAMIYSVSSESLAAIEEIEKICNF